MSVPELPEPYRPAGYLDWNASRRPDAAAVWDGRDISFAELLRHVRKFERRLAARGVRAGDVVGVRLPNVWEYVALEIAIPDLGAVVLPLPPTLGEHEMRWVRDKARPRIVVDTRDDAAGPEAEAVVAAADPNRVVEIALTSGTTGLPKLAALDARLKQVTFEGFTSRLEITEDDRVLPMTPLTQGIGGMCLYCLRRGAALVMLGEPHWTAEHCLATAREAAATVMVGVPTNVIRMLNHPIDLPSVRAVAVAGAPLPPEVAERWETTTGIPIAMGTDAGNPLGTVSNEFGEKRIFKFGRHWRLDATGRTRRYLQPMAPSSRG